MSATTEFTIQLCREPDHFGGAWNAPCSRGIDLREVEASAIRTADRARGNQTKNAMLTRRLAEFVVETTDIPSEVLEPSRHALVDPIGCALAGTLETFTDPMLQRHPYAN
jgi:hypothetical protein